MLQTRVRGESAVLLLVGHGVDRFGSNQTRFQLDILTPFSALQRKGEISVMLS